MSFQRRLHFRHFMSCVTVSCSRLCGALKKRSSLPHQGQARTSWSLGFRRFFIGCSPCCHVRLETAADLYAPPQFFICLREANRCSQLSRQANELTTARSEEHTSELQSHLNL